MFEPNDVVAYSPDHVFSFDCLDFVFFRYGNAYNSHFYRNNRCRGCTVLTLQCGQSLLLRTAFKWRKSRGNGEKILMTSHRSP